MTTHGWRSARGRASGWSPAPAIAPAAAVPAGAAEAGVASQRRWVPVSSGPTLDENRWGNPWTGVPWTLTMVAFMAYTAVIVTYAFKIGTESMVVALLTLPLLQLKFRFPLWLARWTSRQGRASALSSAAPLALRASALSR